MAKTLSLKYKGTTYTLKFTRNSVRLMETQGFSMSNISDKPMTTLPALFSGAFLAEHRYLKKEVIDEIFEVTTNKQELFTKLSEMYYETINALMEEPEENEGNATWEEN